MKKVVLVDDEDSARKLVKEYLETYEELVLLGEANNGVDAIELINKFKPDLVFMDIQMPGMDGFEVLEKLEELPIIIFSTAYDQYALKAFEAHATDYLLKPYTKNRFDKAIDKVNFDGENKVVPLAEDLLASKDRYPERIIVAKNNRYYNIPTAAILQLEAYGDYAKIHAEGETYLSNSRLGELEKRLNPQTFLRVHRSNIVNWQKVKEIDKQGKSYLLTLENDLQIRVSRGQADLIKKRII